MWILVVVVGLIATIIGLWLLQWWRDTTYRPDKAAVRQIIQSSIDGTIEQRTLHRFLSVRIAYSRALDEIRRKYRHIINEPANIDRIVSPERVLPLNDSGRKKLEALLDALDAVTMNHHTESWNK